MDNHHEQGKETRSDAESTISQPPPSYHSNRDSNLPSYYDEAYNLEALQPRITRTYILSSVEVESDEDKRRDSLRLFVIAFGLMACLVLTIVVAEWKVRRDASGKTGTSDAKTSSTSTTASVRPSSVALPHQRVDWTAFTLPTTEGFATTSTSSLTVNSILATQSMSVTSVAPQSRTTG